MYFSPRLTLARDVIEDALNEALGRRGEVTGAGAGERGSNIDIEIFDDGDVDATAVVRETLKSLDVPRDTLIVIGGNKSLLYASH